MLKIIFLEKWTLLKGWLISIAIVFPFTFIPVFFSKETGFQKYVLHIPDALFFSIGFGLVVVVAAVLQNYERLRIRIRVFNTPAFRALNGKWIKEGLGSVSQDLSVSLLIHREGFPYLLTIIIDEDDQEKRYLRISPFYTIGRTIFGEIKSELNKYFKIDNTIRSLALKLPIPDERLGDPAYISKYMTLIHRLIAPGPMVQLPSEFSNKS